MDSVGGPRRSITSTFWGHMHWRHYCRRTFRFCRHYAVLCELLVGWALCPEAHPTSEEKKAADSVPQEISQPDHCSLLFSEYHEPMATLCLSLATQCQHLLTLPSHQQIANLSTCPFYGSMCLSTCDSPGSVRGMARPQTPFR